MKSKKNWAALVVIVMASFLGGLCGRWILPGAKDAQAAPAQGAAVKVVRANVFYLVDKKGKPRAILMMSPSGPMLAMFDEKGMKRIALGSTKQGPGLVLFDEKETQRITLSCTKQGPELDMFDEKGAPRILLGSTEHISGLFMYDKNGKRTWSAPR